MRRPSPSIILLSLSALLFGCGGDGSTDTPTVSAGGTAMKDMNDALSSVSNLAPGGAVTTSGKLRALTASDEWSSTAELSDPRNSGGSCEFSTPITPQAFMQIDFTESATRCNGSDVNVFGRLRSALDIACILLHGLSVHNSDQLPSTCSQT